MTKREADAWICNGCGALTDADAGQEAGPLYECGSCGTRFTREGSADGEGHRCPDCGKFGAKLEDHCCPECDEDGLSPLFRADDDYAGR
jgi:hypothetical protein